MSEFAVGDRVRVKYIHDDLVLSGFEALAGYRTGPGTVESVYPDAVVVVLDEGQAVPYISPTNWNLLRKPMMVANPELAEGSVTIELAQAICYCGALCHHMMPPGTVLNGQSGSESVTGSVGSARKNRAPAPRGRETNQEPDRCGAAPLPVEDGSILQNFLPGDEGLSQGVWLKSGQLMELQCRAGHRIRGWFVLDTVITPVEEVC